MITNVGFNDDGTHTVDVNSPYANMKVTPLPLNVDVLRILNTLKLTLSSAINTKFISISSSIKTRRCPRDYRKNKKASKNKSNTEKYKSNA